MIESLYEPVGFVVVWGVVVAAAAALLIAAVILAWAAWYRSLTRLSNWFLRDFNYLEEDADTVEKWRMQAAFVSAALARFELRKVKPAYHEAGELSDGETTFRDALRDAFLGGDE